MTPAGPSPSAVAARYIPMPALTRPPQKACKQQVLPGQHAAFVRHPCIDSSSLQDAQWWLPDADVYDAMVEVPNVTHVVPHLRSIPQDVLVHKLAAVQAARSRFFFRSELTHPPNAVNTMASGICQRHKWGLFSVAAGFVQALHGRSAAACHAAPFPLDGTKTSRLCMTASAHIGNVPPMLLATGA